MTTTKNRWAIAAAAVGVHISIGSIYAYSLFKTPLNKALGWDPVDTAWAFSIAIACLGLAAAFLGPTVERIGPRRSARLSAMLFCTGLVVAGLAVNLKSLPLFYLGYGVISGIGTGIGYITPVATLVKWFPDRRGLATGLAVMGFGFGALIAGSLIQWLITHVGLNNTFFGLAGVYGTVMALSARTLAPPPEGYMADVVLAKTSGTVPADRQDLADLDSFGALKTLRFYVLWLMFFINITCGIAIISVASPMSQEIAGLTAAAAATMVGLMGLFNGGGRIAWATLSDRLGRPLIFSLFFLIQIAAFWLLPTVRNPLLFQLILFLILSCYGGAFSVVPAFLGDLFGTRQLSSIYGKILTAWAAAGVAGPLIAAEVRKSTGSYSGMLGVFVALLAVALVASIVIQVNIRLIRRSNAQTPEAMTPATLTSH